MQKQLMPDQTMWCKGTVLWHFEPSQNKITKPGLCAIKSCFKAHGFWSEATGPTTQLKCRKAAAVATGWWRNPWIGLLSRSTRSDTIAAMLLREHCNTNNLCKNELQGQNKVGGLKVSNWSAIPRLSKLQFPRLESSSKSNAASSAKDTSENADVLSFGYGRFLWQRAYHGLSLHNFLVRFYSCATWKLCLVRTPADGGPEYRSVCAECTAQMKKARQTGSESPLASQHTENSASVQTSDFGRLPWHSHAVL